MNEQTINRIIKYGNDTTTENVVGQQTPPGTPPMRQSVDINGSKNVKFNITLTYVPDTANPNIKKYAEKVVVSFFDNTELVFNKELNEDTPIGSLQFEKIIEAEEVNDCTKEIDIKVIKEDKSSFIYKLTLISKKVSSLSTDYGDINLIKSDFFDVDCNADYGDTLLLTWETEDPKKSGVSFYNIPIDNENKQIPTIGFQNLHKDNIVVLDPSKSHQEIPVVLSDSISESIIVEYKTRVIPNILNPATTPPPAIIPTDTIIDTLDDNDFTFYDGIPNTHFLHVSGYLNFYPNRSRVENITLPLIDIYGSEKNLNDPLLYYNTYEPPAGMGDILTINNAVSRHNYGAYVFIDLSMDEKYNNIATLEVDTLSGYIKYK